MLAPLLSLGEKLIEKFIPDPQAKAQAQLQLLQMQQNGELRELELKLSAIVEEAKSQDKWTSRARPSFLYVIYIMILACIPMGILHAVSADMANSISAGMQAWLAAIPKYMWELFGVGYLGYVGGRTYDKVTKLKHAKT
jgi:hypothetical protein